MNLTTWISHRTPRVKSSRASFHADVAFKSELHVHATTTPQDFAIHFTSPILLSINRSSSSHWHESSNWFFRASSAGSPHTRAGGRAGGSTPGKRDREAEGGVVENRPASRSGSVSRRRSRSRTGRMGSYLNGSRTDVTSAHISVPSTPSKLVKRKSLGFLQLRKSSAAGREENDEKRIAEPDVDDSPRKERYLGIGLGRATARGVSGDACEGDAGEPGVAVQHGDKEEGRTRRKSFSRFLIDRDKENESTASSKVEASEKEKEKEKAGSRGFHGFSAQNFVGWCRETQADKVWQWNSRQYRRRRKSASTAFIVSPRAKVQTSIQTQLPYSSSSSCYQQSTVAPTPFIPPPTCQANNHTLKLAPCMIFHPHFLFRLFPFPVRYLVHPARPKPAIRVRCYHSSISVGRRGIRQGVNSELLFLHKGKPVRVPGHLRKALDQGNRHHRAEVWILKSPMMSISSPSFRNMGTRTKATSHLYLRNPRLSFLLPLFHLQLCPTIIAAHRASTALPPTYHYRSA
jgi:hypothetical protein